MAPCGWHFAGSLFRPGGGSNDATPLTLADMQALLRYVPDIVAATPSSSRSQTVVFGEMNHTVQVTGTVSV